MKKQKFFKMKLLKKTLALMTKKLQQQISQFAGSNFSLGKSDVFEIYMLKCSLFLRNAYDFENHYSGGYSTTIIIKKE